ncbi:MAG: GNAT family N-acetyltransferase [Vicinamibacterales bacterium]
MTGTVIRELTSADVDSAFTLSSTAGWNQRPEDWRMLLRLAPHGSFAVIADGRIVGTAIGINYGTFGWIAMMLVDPTYRGRGLGGQLLEAAMQAVPSHHPIRLDATPLGRPLYERYGFVEETTLTRLVANSPDRFPTPVGTVDRATKDDLPGVGADDVATFGADRQAVFEWSLSDAPYARIARRGNALAGYCFGRRGRLFDQVGPVIAREEDQARALVCSAIADVPGRPVVVDAYDAHQSFGDWLRSIGFRPERPLFRMSRGATATAQGGALREFTIFGPDFG